MSRQAPETAPFEGFNDIPDPVSAAAARSVSASPVVTAPTEPSMTRAERRKRSAFAIALAFGWITALLTLLGLRADIGSFDVLGPLFLWVFAALLAFIAALRPRERGLPAPSRLVQWIALLIPFVFLTSALWVSRHGVPTPLTLKNTGPCLLWASITAVGPFVLAGFLLQRSFLSAPVWRGAAIGTLCGLCAAAGIHAHCPMTASAHVVLAHGFPIIAGGLLGALFGALRGRA